MSVISILGNTSPRIGTATKYVAITPYANILRNSMATSQENILWDIYVLENGKWRKTQGNSKKGKEVEYTFSQRSLLRKGIKLVANIDGKTGELLIKPMLALAPKILKVELLDFNYRKISKILNYTDVIRARAHCVDLDGQKIDFSLWEDDVIGSGHHKDNESNHIATASAKVIKGRADVTFNMSYYTFASYIANMQKPKGQKSEGDTHEYYVTAEYNHKKTASNNINIKNTQNEQPQSNTPKSSTKKSSKYNVLDKKGIVYSIELQDKKGNKINRNIRYGETIKVVIRGHNLVNKPCVLKLWEHDTFGDNDLLYRQNIVMKNSPHEVSITLTSKMQTIGEIGNKPKNPDIGEYSLIDNYQEVFAEVIYDNLIYRTKPNIKVNINALPTKQETGKSASKVGGNKKDEKKETRKEGMENYAVVVLTGEITGKGKASKHRGDYYMYKVKIYNNVSYDYYLENKKSLTPSYTHELSRDSWMPSKSRSSKRYGSKNETPPGVYWITYYSKGIGSKKYNIKVSDTKDGDYINGIHGRREGIRIHHYSPHFSEGCITTGNNGKASVMDFIEKIPAIKNNPVILIIEERKVEYKDNIYKGIK